jgi:uncharacterized protein YbjQ (UPF0145 family)
MARQMPNDLPQWAFERLNMMRGNPTQRGLFTSDLSVNEFLLVRQAGFEPVGLVVGSSIYHIGFQAPHITQNVELDVLTRAMYNARQLAMTCMEEEANALGADGVIGVHMEITSCEWGEGLSEFTAIGTAIRATNGRSYRNVRGMPFTSDLSGQDFWTLLRAGYMPAGLVMGSCVYHVAYQSLGQWFKQIGRNVEMPYFTQAIYEAREIAMMRMQAEALNLNAQGIVETQITMQNYEWEAHVIEFYALGTAVVPMEGSQSIPAPNLSLLLNDSD